MFREHPVTWDLVPLSLRGFLSRGGHPRYRHRRNRFVIRTTVQGVSVPRKRSFSLSLENPPRSVGQVYPRTGPEKLGQ